MADLPEIEWLDPKLSDEIVFANPDFAGLFADGITLASWSIVITVYSGNADASPQSIASGSTTMSGMVGAQKIIAGNPGTNYLLTCKGIGSDGTQNDILLVLPVVAIGSTTTLIVEDGSVVANAQSYISVSAADAYLKGRGETTFAAAQLSDQENALRAATYYMVSEYRYRWAGFRYSVLQNLDWPRSYVPITDISTMGYGGDFLSYVNFNVVPVEVQQACADLAVRWLATSDLAPDIERRERSVKVGPLAVEYDPYSTQVTIYRAVETKLSPYFVGHGQRTSIVRT